MAKCEICDKSVSFGIKLATHTGAAIKCGNPISERLEQSLTVNIKE